MKRLICILTILLLCLTGCGPQAPDPGTTGESSAQTLPKNPVGWHTVDGSRYCFNADGTPLTGWLNDNGLHYYLNDQGMALTGWQLVEGKRFYFQPDGAMTTGWATLEDGTYYFGIDGSLFTGLLNIGGKGYYFSESGEMYSGWLTLQDKTCYFGTDGVMAVGPTEIDGVTHYFSPRGVQVLLVNPWNPLPQDYAPELVDVTETDRLEKVCAEALEKMLTDCKNAGCQPMIVSAYRTQADQEFLYNRKVNYYLELDWDPAEAAAEAAKSVAIPGTSEHQLGLAVDIIDIDYGILDDHQADTKTQKWLMEHCYQYGFILRYPKGTTDITGIIYEPWHYRYVGQEIAQEIMNLGITLEEYLGAA